MTTNHHLAISGEKMRAALPKLLAAVPGEWRGTTFKNHNLLGRRQFAENMADLIKSNKEEYTEEDMVAVGNAEDYLRVASNVSTTLELTLARVRDIDVDQVWSFASTRMPVLSVLLTAGDTPVTLYTGDAPAMFTPAHADLLALLGVNLTQKTGPPQSSLDAIVLALDSAGGLGADGVIAGNVLYIINVDKIKPDEILVIRKRMSTPLTTPVAIAMMQELCGLPDTGTKPAPSQAELDAFYAHLQTMSGTAANPACQPAVFTAGLSAICSMYVALLKQKGCNLLMCSTAYGGSSQLTDLITSRAPTFSKSTFDIQGDADIGKSIQTSLNALAKDPAALHPTTVLFVEIPTNPDMKVPDLDDVGKYVSEYKAATGKRVILCIDATFAPSSKVMEKVRAMDPDLPCLAFISMSKSVSQGETTAGALVANHTPDAIELLGDIRECAAMMDTAAKTDQLHFLCKRHAGTEERCAEAYQVAKAVGDALRVAVKKNTGTDMPLAFVREEHAKIGFTSSTFSFNLPVPEGASAAQTAALGTMHI